MSNGQKEPLLLPEPVPADNHLRAHHLKTALNYLARTDLFEDGFLLYDETGATNIPGYDRFLEDRGYPKGLGSYFMETVRELYKQDADIIIIDSDDSICRECRCLSENNPKCINNDDYRSRLAVFGSIGIEEKRKIQEKKIGFLLGKRIRFRDIAQPVIEAGGVNNLIEQLWRENRISLQNYFFFSLS